MLLNNGDGTFQAPISYDLSGSGAGTVGIADLNGDGHPDLVVVDCCSIDGNGPGTVSVLLNNGDGTFQTLSVTALCMIPVLSRLRTSTATANPI